MRNELSSRVRADSRSMACNTLVAEAAAFDASSYAYASPLSAERSGDDDDDSGGRRSSSLLVAISTPTGAGAGSALPPVPLPLPPPVHRNGGSCRDPEAAAAARGRTRAARISVPNVLRKSSRPPTLKSNSSKPGRVRKSGRTNNQTGQARREWGGGGEGQRAGTRS